MTELIAAADGSSLANPGPAGWAWYIDDQQWASGGWAHATNNMAELMAVLSLLESTAGDRRELRVLCDSQYVINSLTKWLPGWKRKGWRKGDGKPVQNVELMRCLADALSGRKVHFEWVKGHAGHPLNERADSLARAAAEAYRAGGEPEPGPGFGGKIATGDVQRFRVGQTQPQPDLFSVMPEPATAAKPPGTASDRVKSELISKTRLLVSDEIRMDESRLRELLHQQFVSHAIDGQVVGLDHGPWEPLSDKSFEVLSVDQYAPEIVGMRWLQADRLRYSLWQHTTEGWKLRFAQVTRR